VCNLYYSAYIVFILKIISDIVRLVRETGTLNACNSLFSCLNNVTYCIGDYVVGIRYLARTLKCFFLRDPNHV
jgi:hypothetical protein